MKMFRDTKNVFTETETKCRVFMNADNFDLPAAVVSNYKRNLRSYFTF